MFLLILVFALCWDVAFLELGTIWGTCVNKAFKEFACVRDESTDALCILVCFIKFEQD